MSCEEWRRAVARVTWTHLEVDLPDLEVVHGPLPLELGYESGDSPAEFVGGATAPLVERST